MTKDEIIRTARKVWGEQAILPFDDLERFAVFVSTAEREACAKVADGYIGADPIATAIRERSSEH